MSDIDESNEKAPLSASLVENVDNELNLLQDGIQSDADEFNEQNNASSSNENNTENKTEKNKKQSKRNWMGFRDNDDVISEPKDATRKGIVFSFPSEMSVHYEGDEKSPLSASLVENADNELNLLQDGKQNDADKFNEQNDASSSESTSNNNDKKKNKHSNTKTEKIKKQPKRNWMGFQDNDDEISETKDDTRKGIVFSFPSEMSVHYEGDEKSPLSTSLVENANNELNLLQDGKQNDADEFNEQNYALSSKSTSNNNDKKKNKHSNAKTEKNKKQSKKNWMGFQDNDDEISETKDVTRKGIVFSFPSVRREVHEDSTDYKDKIDSSSSSSSSKKDEEESDEDSSSSSSSSGEESDDESENNNSERENLPEAAPNKHKSFNEEERKGLPPARSNNGPRFPWGRRKKKSEAKKGLLNNDATDDDFATEGIENDNLINKKLHEQKQNNGNFLFGLHRKTQELFGNQNQKLKSMKIATEDTKDQSDWKESLTNAIAVMAVPELHAEDEEEQLGKYRKIALDTSFDENDDGDINYKAEYEHLRDRVADLERMINSSELKCQVWRERAHALEKEVERLRRGDDCESQSNNDDSSADTGNQDTTEDDREVGWGESYPQNVQEGHLINLGTSAETIDHGAKKGDGDKKDEDPLNTNSSGTDGKSGNDPTHSTEILLDLEGINTVQAEMNNSETIESEKKDEVLIDVSSDIVKSDDPNENAPKDDLLIAI